MTSETIGLIDGDVLCYTYAFRNQDEFDWDGDGEVTISSDVDKAIEEVDDHLIDLYETLNLDHMIVCISSAVGNWRKLILPEYKANRVKSNRPEAFYGIRHHLLHKYDSRCWSMLEADDVMGILSTDDELLPGNKIIVSIDKDMQTIPGWLWNGDPDVTIRNIKEREADYNHMLQTLTGDSTDNYKGCPGIGKKKAKALIKMDQPVDVMWSRVVEAFQKKDLTEYDALIQARVARILRTSDYDYENGEVLLWEP